jgi:UTP:GlnB (protein PII) uridylyltransferase
MTGMSESGMVVDVFDLDLTNNESPDWNRITSHLADGLKDPATLAARLERRARSGRMPIRPGAARLAAPRVLIDNASTPRASIVEVRTADSLGILSRIARTIAERGCDIRFVRALTLGHEVVDSFYVIDSDTGAKLSDEARLVALQDAILNELHEGTAGRALFG